MEVRVSERVPRGNKKTLRVLCSVKEPGLLSKSGGLSSITRTRFIYVRIPVGPVKGSVSGIGRSSTLYPRPWSRSVSSTTTEVPTGLILQLRDLQLGTQERSVLDETRDQIIVFRRPP